MIAALKPLPEIAIQQAFRKALYYAGPTVRAIGIPNAGKRSQWAAAQAKREGLAKGFPDMAIYWPGGGHALIEFKAEKGRVSIDQAEWHTWLDDAGFPVAVCRSADAAIDFLRAVGAPVRGLT